MDRVVHYWVAFDALHTSRTTGFETYNPISIGEIKDYLDLIGETDVDRRVMTMRHVKTLDGMFLNHHRQKQKQTTPMR